ncbi:hypothetical protein PCK1_002428 [Pneumocystis canis]|nr:hypothetical protein PCK1_002428 [Pneumocystis canis]
MSTSNEETDDSIESMKGLAEGREKRITAGNRLQALLDQELEEEAIFDVGDDQDDDFDGEQQPLHDIEISESDDQENTSEGEDYDEELERLEKKTKMKKKKPPETFFKPRILKEKRVRKPPSQLFSVIHPNAVRHSSRAHTIENKNLIDLRLKEAQKRREKQNFMVRIREKPMTQEERIAEAKITEEKNKALLQKLIKMEEEKKRKIKNLLKTNKTITGPFIRFWSKGIEQRLDGKWVFSNSKNTNIKETDIIDAKIDEKNIEKTIEYVDNPNNCLSSTQENFVKIIKKNEKNICENSPSEEQETSNTEILVTKTASQQSTNDTFSYFHTDDKQSEESCIKSVKTHQKENGELPQGPPMLYSRSYIMLEGFSEPFDLNKQKNVLFLSSNTPIQPEKQFCFITGKIAKYKDPISGLYYNDLAAYQTIHQIIKGDISWSRLAGTFIGTLRPAHGVPLNFYDTITSNE